MTITIYYCPPFQMAKTSSDKKPKSITFSKFSEESNPVKGSVLVKTKVGSSSNTSKSKTTGRAITRSASGSGKPHWSATPATKPEHIVSSKSTAHVSSPGDTPSTVSQELIKLRAMNTKLKEDTCNLRHVISQGALLYLFS